MPMLQLALLMAAFIIFVLTAGGLKADRINLIAAGLACWTLSQFIGALFK